MEVLKARKEERDLVAATQVCVRWHEILASAPSLWARIDVKYPGHLPCLYLKRSKGTLIDVTLGKPSNILNPADKFVASTLWIARTKTLCIQGGPGQIREIAEGLCQEAPSLRSLTIEGNGASACVHFPDNFLGKYAPSLQSLTLCSVSPQKVFTLPLPKLTHIDWVAGHVVIEELLELFESSPLLESIRMAVLIQTDRKKPLKKVTLSNLCELEWADSGGSTSLMSYLIAPKLNKLDIRITHNPQHRPTTLSSTLPSDGNHIPLLLEPVAVAYVHEYGTRTYYFDYPETACLVISESNINPTISRWFSPDFPISFSRVRKLGVQAIASLPPLDEVPIERFESLHELQLIGKVDSLAQMMGGNNDRLIPCPALSKIWISPINGSSSLGKLKKVLEKRREAGHRVKTVQISRVNKCMDAEIEGLRTLVDEVITE